MTDFLTRLTGRTLGLLPTIRPQSVQPFAPAPPIRMTTNVQPLASSVSRHSSSAAIEPGASPAVSPFVDSATADAAHSVSSPLQNQPPALSATGTTTEPFSDTSSVESAEETLQSAQSAKQSANETPLSTTHARGHPPTAPLVRSALEPDQPIEHAVEQPTARPIAQPAAQLVEQSIAQPATQPAEQPITQPATQLVEQPIAQSSALPTAAESYDYQAISNDDPALPWALPEQPSSSVVAGLVSNEPLRAEQTSISSALLAETGEETGLEMQTPQTRLSTHRAISNATSHQAQTSPARSELLSPRLSRSLSPQTLDQSLATANRSTPQKSHPLITAPSPTQASLLRTQPVATSPSLLPDATAELPESSTKAVSVSQTKAASASPQNYLAAADTILSATDATLSMPGSPPGRQQTSEISQLRAQATSAQSLARRQPAETPTVTVSIGRIVVTGKSPSPTKTTTPKRSRQKQPKLSLQDYLKQRQGG